MNEGRLSEVKQRCPEVTLDGVAVRLVWMGLQSPSFFPSLVLGAGPWLLHDSVTHATSRVRLRLWDGCCRPSAQKVNGAGVLALRELAQRSVRGPCNQKMQQNGTELRTDMDCVNPGGHHTGRHFDRGINVRLRLQCAQ